MRDLSRYKLHLDSTDTDSDRFNFQQSGLFDNQLAPTPLAVPADSPFAPTLLTPAVNITFAGPTQNGQAIGWNPPDNNIGAGINDVITVVNDEIDVYDKFGNHLFYQTLNAFFGVSEYPTNFLFDPRVMWDQFTSRYIVTTDEHTGTSSNSNYSILHIAVSKDSNPADGWYTFSENFKLGNNWIDYPVLGIDSTNIYVTGNYFTAAESYAGSEVWAANKASLESGVDPGFHGYDVTALGAPAEDLYVPAHMYGTKSGFNGDFMVEYGQNNAGNDTVHVIEVQNASTGTATFSLQSINVGNISDLFPTGAVQPGTSTVIDSGDSRMQNSVWFNDRLYAVTEVRVGSGATAHDVVHWFEFDTTTLGAISLLHQGNLDFGANTSTYYGNLTVDQSGNMIIGYSYSNSTNAYASSAYVTVDPNGNQTDLGIFLANGQGQNTNDRWGDYSGISIDPVDGNSFWVFNQYATNTNSWATTIGGRQLYSDDYADDAFTTGSVASGSSLAGTLNFAGDHDWFKVTLTAGHNYLINERGAASSGGTLTDPYLRLVNPAGGEYGHDDDSGVGNDAQLAIHVTTTGTYYIDAAAHNDATNGTYSVNLQDLGTSSFRYESPILGVGSFGASVGGGGWSSNDQFSRELADVDGDGLADIVGFGNAGPYVSLATGGGHFAAPVLAINDFGAGAGGGNWSSENQFPRELADVDGDGKADIIGFGNAGVYVSLATGGGHFGASFLAINDFGAAPGGGAWSSEDQFPRELADVNGDHMADIIAFGNAGAYVSLATSGGHFAAPFLALNAFGAAVGGGGWSSENQFPRELADVDGDGKADIVGFGNAGPYVSLATGGGHFAAPFLAINDFGAGAGGGNWSSENQFPRELADVNGDHMADIVGFGNAGPYVSFATGGGHFAAPVQALDYFGAAAGGGGWSTNDQYPRLLADVTGDQKADIIAFGSTGTYVSASHDYLVV